MDLFVCGDYASISCGTWVAVWNGAIGALVAAVLGALVALGVVLMSNRHQSLLADKARKEARGEAEKAREIIAIADMIALTAWMGWTYDTFESFDVGNAYQKLEAGRVRLQMASPSSVPLARALNEWASLLTSLAIAEGRAEKHGHDMQREIHTTLGLATAAVSGCLPDWPHDDEFSRKASLIVLGQVTEKMAETRAVAVEAGLLSPWPAKVRADAGNAD